jgi:hypothetical protein
VGRNDDISLSLVKAKLRGFLPDVKDSEVDFLDAQAQIIYAGDNYYPTPNDLLVGEATMTRREITSSAAVSGTQSLRLTYFTAKKTELISQVNLTTGGTAAAATPTLCRIGIYSVADNGDLTLVASTVNDTTLFATATTLYTKALQVPFTKVRGQRYAVGVLIVSGVATPTFHGYAFTLGASVIIEPKLSAIVNTQADLPSSVANGSLAASSQAIYTTLLP